MLPIVAAVGDRLVVPERVLNLVPCTVDPLALPDDHGAAVRDLDRMRERFKRRAASSTVS